MSRTRLGKAKHIEIQHLWLQEAVRSGKLSGEDPHRDELLGLGNETYHKREIGDVEEARELLLCMRLWTRVQVANLARTGRG